MNYNNTSENVECPICMECILDTKNKVTTECGHCFHTNCLMTSVAHNGFGCPYCRTAMAEAVDDDDDDGFDDSDWATSNSDEDDDRASKSDIFYQTVGKSLSIRRFYGSRYALSAKKMASLRNTPTERLTKIMAADLPYPLTVPRKFAEKFRIGCTPTKCRNF